MNTATKTLWPTGEILVLVPTDDITVERRGAHNIVPPLAGTGVRTSQRGVPPRPLGRRGPRRLTPRARLSPPTGAPEDPLARRAAPRQRGPRLRPVGTPPGPTPARPSAYGPDGSPAPAGRA